jgi:topoisomerase-4 subunit A
LVETENKEELIITEHPNSQLEIVSTDYRPVVELIFPKIKGFKKKQ